MDSSYLVSADGGCSIASEVYTRALVTRLDERLCMIGER